jgi:hypothetical protein
MNPNPNNPASIEDPRCRPDFLPRYYPQANGREAPSVGATDQNDAIQLKFLAVYYELNLAHARLQEVRQTPASAERKKSEKLCLQAVERLLIMRDGIEDGLAPLGVIADPVVQGGVTVNVKFSFGNVDAAGRRRSDWYTITACVPIPLAQEFKFEDLPIQIEGPGINPD